MGLLNQIGMANPGLVFSQIDAENLRKKQVADMERWRQEQQAFQREQAGLMAPYRQAQVQMLQRQLQDYRTPEQQQEMDIARARELAKIQAGMREYNKQLVPVQDAYGNVQYRVFDPRSGSFADIPQVGGQQQQAQLAQQNTLQFNGAQERRPAVDPTLPAPSLSPSSNLMSSSPLNFGSARDASGNPVNLGPGVKWNQPKDMKLPDGSTANVQFDTTGRFYRPIGPAAKLGGQSEANKYAGIVLEDIGRAKNLANDYWVVPNTGIGAALNWVPGTSAKDLSATLDTIRANVGFDRLQQMRNSSPTGGALGQVSEMENKLLQSTLGSLEQSQSKEQFLKNLDRLQRTYMDIVHGPRNWSLDTGGTAGGPEAGRGPAGGPGVDADALIRKYRFGGQ